MTRVVPRLNLPTNAVGHGATPVLYYALPLKGAAVKTDRTPSKAGKPGTGGPRFRCGAALDERPTGLIRLGDESQEHLDN